MRILGIAQTVAAVRARAAPARVSLAKWAPSASYTAQTEQRPLTARWMTKNGGREPDEAKCAAIVQLDRPASVLMQPRPKAAAP